MDTTQHLAQPNKVVETDGQRIEFRPIFHHPYNGWEIVSVAPATSSPYAVPGSTRIAKARWIADAALEEIPEGSDVTFHLEGILRLLAD